MNAPYKRKKTLAERLADKIEKETGLLCEPKTFRRTYAGHWQKAAGAFVWTIMVAGSNKEIGSRDTATICVKKNYILTLKNGEIVAERVYNNEP